jgi:hypothetical protein
MSQTMPAGVSIPLQLQGKSCMPPCKDNFALESGVSQRCSEFGCWSGSNGRRLMLLSKEPTADNRPVGECIICGVRTELYGLPRVEGDYCLECSADIGTSLLLRTEIDAATMAGQRTDLLMAEFTSLTDQLVKRAQNKNNNRNKGNHWRWQA